MASPRMRVDSANRLRGLARSAIVAVSAVCCTLLASHVSAYLVGALRWTEMLFPRPGSSGFVLLLLSPIAFLVTASIVRWISDGFHRGGL